MSNSNYSVGLQRLKPVHTAYCGLHNLAKNWSLARDVNDRDETEKLTIFLETRRDRLKTETSRWRRQPWLTCLYIILVFFLSKIYSRLVLCTSRKVVDPLDEFAQELMDRNKKYPPKVLSPSHSRSRSRSRPRTPR